MAAGNLKGKSNVLILGQDGGFVNLSGALSFPNLKGNLNEILSAEKDIRISGEIQPIRLRGISYFINLEGSLDVAFRGRILRASESILRASSSFARASGRDSSYLNSYEILFGNVDTIINGPTYGPEVYKTLVFDGVDDFVSIRNNGFIIDSFTVCIWIYPDSGSDIKTLLSNSSGGFTTDGIRFFYNSYLTSDGKIYVETGNGSSGLEVTSSTGIIQDDVWQQVCFTVDRVNTIAKIFHNGVQVGSGTILSDFDLKPMQNIYAGLMTNGFAFKGKISTCNIYDRILTDAEILSNYNLQSQWNV